MKALCTLIAMIASLCGYAQLNTAALQGKKVVVVILPEQQDTAVCNQLIRFKNKVGDKAAVLALGTSTAIAHGYQPAADAGVIITTGVATATDGNAYESMLKWLTDKTATEPKRTYFLSKKGRMYAQLDATTTLDMPMADIIVKMNVPGDN